MPTNLAVAALSAAKPEGQTGTTPFTFTVTRSGDTTGATDVDYAVTGSGGSAADAADFIGGILPAGTVSFAAGETSKIITIQVNGDTLGEVSEGFTLTLSNAGTATITTATATGTIQTDEALFAIATASASKAEGNSGTTSLTFTVTRSGDTSGANDVSYAVTGNGTDPASAADFSGGTLPTGSLQFTAGQTSKTVTITVATDTLAEPNETFAVTLSGATGTGATIVTPEATGTIQNDDTSLTITATTATNSEGDSGTTPFTFTITRTGITTGASTVKYAVTGSGTSAANAADFGGSLPTATVSFAAGETVKVITVNVAGDTIVENDETFTVTLSSATGATLANTTAIGLIQADETGVAIAATSATKAEGTAGGGVTTPFTFTVTRTGDISGASTVDYAVTGSGSKAADATDFDGGALPTGTVSFAAGETTQIITIDVAADTVLEPAEGFTVTLSNPGGTSILTAAAAGSITNDDVIEFAVVATDASKLEGNTGTTAFTFTVTRSGDTSQANDVNYAVGAAGTTTDKSDFGGTVPSGVLKFAAGETSKLIVIDVVGDTAVEGDETFVLTLTSPTNGATVKTAAATGTIQADDTALTITATSTNKDEGNSGTTAHTFTVNRTGDLSGTSTVDYAVTGSGANAADDTDFAGGTLPAGTVNFAAGESSKVITIDVSGDTSGENTETFAVTLSNANGSTIGTAAATGTIKNDDTAVSIAATTASKAEGNSGTTALTFTVTRSGVTTGASTVDYVVTGSGANAADATDFVGGTLPGGTVSFAAGVTSKTITINVAGDTVRELDENFQVTLTNPTNTAIIASGTVADGTIKNDEIGNLSIAATSASKNEGNGGTTGFTFTVTRAGDKTGADTVDYTVTGTGTKAADAADFGGSLPTGTVSFAAGEVTKVITIDVAGDSTSESDETFQVMLSNPSAGAAITGATATGTIKNDDSPSVSIAATDATLPEGDTGATNLLFTVTRSGDVTAGGTVDYAVSSSGTAGANAADFGGTLPTGTVTFLAGETTKIVQIAVIGDITREVDETFVVTLANATGGATIGTKTATGTIKNDDTTTFNIAATDADKSEGNTGTTDLTFTVTRTGDVSALGTINYAVTGTGTSAADAADFGKSLPSGKVSFAAGETSKIVTVSVTGDTTGEADETFQVTLSGAATGTLVGTASATGTIKNDDFATISIAATDASKLEGTGKDGGVFLFALSRAGDTSTATTVTYTVAGSGSNAADAADFGKAFPTGTVTFAAGEATKTLLIQSAPDAVLETDEAFTVTLSNPTGGATILTAQASGVILNDDQAGLSISAVDASSPEGNSGTRQVRFNVTRTGDTTQAIAVDWLVNDVAPGAGVANALDFGGVLPAGTVNFAAGETTRTILVGVQGDTTVELNETFTVSLTNATGGAAIKVAAASATIIDDDKPTTGDMIKTVSPGGTALLVGTRGDDVFIGTSAGVDSVVQNGVKFSQSTLSRNADGSVQISGPNGADRLYDVDRVKFDDGVLLLGLSPNASPALRLYQAALGRMPDEGGLKVQTAALDGGLDLLQLARNFVQSNEFRTLYGEHSSDLAFVTSLYRNVLGRAPDSGGMNVQLSALTHGVQRAELLRNFSEAAENMAKTAPLTTVGVFAGFADPLLQ